MATSRAPLHQWNLGPDEATRLQRSLASKVRLRSAPNAGKTVCGLDVAYAVGSDIMAAAAVVLATDSLEVIEQATVVTRAEFPYVSGLFSFREMPALLEVLDRLRATPDLVVCDGHGFAHPERFGLACHLGLWTELPTIGCAKTMLVGEFGHLALDRGATQPLVHDGDMVGHALRTQTGVKPVFVSPGHNIDFADATAWILKLAPSYRLPETTRAADQLAAEALKDRT